MLSVLAWSKRRRASTSRRAVIYARESLSACPQTTRAYNPRSTPTGPAPFAAFLKNSIPDLHHMGTLLLSRSVRIRSILVARRMVYSSRPKQAPPDWTTLTLHSRRNRFDAPVPLPKVHLNTPCRRSSGSRFDSGRRTPAMARGILPSVTTSPGPLCESRLLSASQSHSCPPRLPNDSTRARTPSSERLSCAVKAL